MTDNQRKAAAFVSKHPRGTPEYAKMNKRIGEVGFDAAMADVK